MIRNFLRALLCAIFVATLPVIASAGTFKTSLTTASAAASAWITQANGGSLVVYGGSSCAQATNPETAVPGTCTALVTLTFNATSFTGPVTTSGVGAAITASFVNSSPTVATSGTAKWYRIYKSDGTTPVADGAIGQGSSGCGYDMCLAAVDLGAGATLPVTSMVITIKAD